MQLTRRIVLKILKATAVDIKIKHHLTGYKFLLNTYHHKGYWYYGKKRKENTIEAFKLFIKPHSFVLEIGGHIGYFTTFYAQLVGEAGKVDVFEPGRENLKYLYRNVRLLPVELQKIVTVVHKGAGDTDGELDFYIDPVTGQNNSFVKNFEVFYSNRENSAENKAEPIKEKVVVTRLDTWFQDKKALPDFVKIDVEGFEWNVIQGFVKSIEQKHPDLMVEVHSDSEKIIRFFKDRGYTIYNDKMDEIKNHADYLRKKTNNIFFRYLVPGKNCGLGTERE